MKFELVRYNRNCPKPSGWFSGRARCTDTAANGGGIVYNEISVKTAPGQEAPFGLVPGAMFEADIVAQTTWRGNDQYELENIVLVSKLTSNRIRRYLQIDPKFSAILTDTQIDQLVHTYGNKFEWIARFTPEEVVSSVRADLKRQRMNSKRPLTVSACEVDVETAARVIEILRMGSAQTVIRRLFPSLKPTYQDMVAKDVLSSLSMIRRLSGCDADGVADWLVENPYRLSLVSGISFTTAQTEARTDSFKGMNDTKCRIEAAVMCTLLSAQRGEVIYDDKPLYEYDEQCFLKASYGNYVDLYDTNVCGYVLNRVSNMLSDVTQNGGWSRMDSATLFAVIDKLVADKLFVIDKTYGAYDVYPRYMWDAQQHIIDFVQYRARRVIDESEDASIMRFVRQYRNKDGHLLTNRQRTAVGMCLRSNVSILTGGPGTGKSFCIRSIIECALEHGVGQQNIYCLAPTGKAIAHLKDVCDIPGIAYTTVHSMVADIERKFKDNGLCEFDDDGLSKYNMSHQPQKILVIVDETSMVDVSIMGRLCALLPVGAQIVFCGDFDQLPSPSPGELLRDLIDGGLRVACLSENMRSGHGSQVVRHAKCIVDNDVQTALTSDPGFEVIETRSDDDTVEAVMNLYRKCLADGSDLSDIAVITPRSKGGVDKYKVARINLTRRIADEVHKRDVNTPVYQVDRRRKNRTYSETSGVEIEVPAIGATKYRKPEMIFRVGDRVMKIRRNDAMASRFTYHNNDLDAHIEKTQSYIANGDVATIVRYYPDQSSDGMVMLQFDDKSVTEVTIRDLYREWQGAWAMSVHKSQGSEYRHVIVAFPQVCPYGLTERSLLYTAVTRAKHDVYLVGSKSVMQTCISHVRSRRLSRMPQMLQNGASI